VLAAQRHLDFSPVIVVATTAAIIGDNIGYLIGRHGGRRLLLRDGLAAIHRRRFLTDSEAFFRRRGSIVVFLGRWLPCFASPPRCSPAHTACSGRVSCSGTASAASTAGPCGVPRQQWGEDADRYESARTSSATRWAEKGMRYPDRSSPAESMT
jgi:hypothetical protein